MSEEAKASGEEDEKVKRLSTAQWAEITALWEHGKATAKEISVKYEISETSVFRYFKRNGITWKSRIDEVKTAAAAAASGATAVGVSDFIEKRQERIEETKEKHYSYQKALDDLLMSRIIEAAKAKTPIATLSEDIKAIRGAKAALAIGRRERYAVLGAENEIDDRELSNLLIEEKTDEDIRAAVGSADLDEDEIIADLEEKIAKP